MPSDILKNDDCYHSRYFPFGPDQGGRVHAKIYKMIDDVLPSENAEYIDRLMRAAIQQEAKRKMHVLRVN